MLYSTKLKKFTIATLLITAVLFIFKAQLVYVKVLLIIRFRKPMAYAIVNIRKNFLVVSHGSSITWSGE